MKRGANRAADPATAAGPMPGTMPAITGAAQGVVVTLLGAAGMIVSAFLEWIRPAGVEGQDLNNRVFFDTSFSTNVQFVRSAGAVAIVLGLVAILGLASRAGWITRLAGAAGIVAFALFTITLNRMDADLPTALGVGAWVLLGGSLLALFGGFFTRRPRVVVTTAS